MKLKLALMVGALALAGCNSETPATKGAARQSGGPAIAVQGDEQRILAIGDSLFAGYGLKPGESYPARLEAALRATGVNARITNAGVSGDTSADIRQRLAFTLDNQPSPPALVIVELGGNDLLRALPPEQLRANLDAVLTELKRRDLPVLVMGMLAPPNLGKAYGDKFNPIYTELAKQHDAMLVPFFLQAVIGKPELVQADHLHPTAPGVEAIVQSTLSAVSKILPQPDRPPSP
ncbi:MAG TPA: arylesterase [Novosphingobium sp.]|nr:arylesterase [Novosphingobium sp.]